MPVCVVCDCICTFHNHTAVVIVPKWAVVPWIVELNVAVDELIVELLKIALVVGNVTVMIMVIVFVVVIGIMVIPNNMR